MKSTKVSQLYAGLSLEKQLRKEILDFLQYDAVSVVMDNVGFWFESNREQIDKIYKKASESLPS